MSIEVFKLHRSIVEHEDSLTNQRTTWLLASNAVLVIPFLRFQEAIDSPGDIDEKYWVAASLVTYLIAVAFSMIVGLGQVAASWAIIATEWDYLRIRYKLSELEAADPEDDRMLTAANVQYDAKSWAGVPIALYPRTGRQVLGLTPLFFPALFVIAWTVLFLMSANWNVANIVLGIAVALTFACTWLPTFLRSRFEDAKIGRLVKRLDAIVRQ